MAKEESTIGGTGTLLGTASLQRALDTLNKSVQSLTTAYSQGKSTWLQGKSGGAPVQGGWKDRTLGWAGKDWNAESNRPGTPNGGGSAPPPPQPRGKAYRDELLGGGSRGGSRGDDADAPVGNGGHSKIRGAGRVVGAAALYVTASGMSQLDDRVLMNTTTSMLDRTAVKGSGSRSMFQDNFTSHGGADVVNAQKTVQSMGFAYGTSGYAAATNYNRTAGLVDPNTTQTQAAAASANLQTGNTFNTLRMFGISTIGPGGKPVSPRDLAHQFIAKVFSARKPTTGAEVEASLGQKSRFGQSLSAMVSRGMLDQNTADQVTGEMRAQLTAGLKGKSYDQYSATMNKYANKDPFAPTAEGREAKAALTALGLKPTDAQAQMAQQGQKMNQLDANNKPFSDGLQTATGLLDQFSKALTGILSTWAGSALGASQGFLGGGVGTTAGKISGGVQQAAVTYGGVRLAQKIAARAAGKPVAESPSLVSKVVTGARLAGRVAAKAGPAALAYSAVDAALNQGEHSARMAASKANNGGSSGLFDGPNTYAAALLNTLTFGLTDKMESKGTGSQGWDNQASSGQDGGAGTGQDRASGAAAKATGTVGSGKTAANVIAIAKQYLGVPYHYGGTSPQQGFDCAGLTQYVFKQVGVNMPRTAQAQQTAGKPVNKKDAQPGDLVFFGGNAKTGGAHHVALMVSSSQVIEAAHTGTKVRIRSFSMDEVSTVGRFLGSMGSMSTDAVANTDGASSKTGSGSSAGTSFASAFFANALNEMDTLAGALGSFLGSTSAFGKGSGATKDTAKDTAKAAGGTGGNGGPALAGGSGNAQKVFNTLVGQGFTTQAAAGVIGNLMQESGVDPNSHQGGGGPGRGIMQWTVDQRWASLIKWAGKKNPRSLDTQVGFMMKEMNAAGVTGKLKGMTDVNAATSYFETSMEAAGTPNMAARFKYAGAALSQYGGKKKSYAVGSTNIDVDQDARVHKGEIIIPAHQAEAVRQALAGNNPISTVTGLGGKGVQITFEKESIKIILGTGVTSSMGTKVGRQIVDTIVNDKRLADIARGV